MEAPRQVTLGKLQDEVPGVFQGSRRSRELAWWRRQLLHPTVAAKVVGAFVRPEYDTAVFQAFKEVEVAVRAKGKSPDTEVGVPLMRRAFDPKAGPLRDQNAVEAEREATAHLFAGAMGSFKNPHSHRNVPITDPAEAVELLLLASRLLRIVDARHSAAASLSAAAARAPLAV